MSRPKPPRPTHFQRTFFLLLSGLLLSSALLAAPEDRGQPLEISADRAVFNERTGVATYRGNVRIRQGSLEIEAEEIVVTTDKQGNLQATRSTGSPARYRELTADQKRVSAEARQIDHNLERDLLTLTGAASLRQDSASFSGERILYDKRQQRIDASGSGNNRVQLVLPPQAGTLIKKKDRKP